jgi:hypothetical protein
MQLALSDLFQARWTDQIHDEWTRSVGANRPDITPASLARCRQLMNEHVSDCLVTGYESLIPNLTLPDPDDRHVLAAAIRGVAGSIITFNLSDFPSSILEPFDIEAIHPDEFIVRLWDVHLAGVLEAMRLQRVGLKRPPKTATEYIETLERCRLSDTAARLRSYSDQI